MNDLNVRGVNDHDVKSALRETLIVMSVSHEMRDVRSVKERNVKYVMKRETGVILRNRSVIREKRIVKRRCAYCDRRHIAGR